jgi:hypothetical protein
VVIASGTLITNCHVLAKAKSFIVKRDNIANGATLQHADFECDMCQIQVRNFSAPAVELAPTAALRVGQCVCAVGNPRGLELTFGDGLVSGLRRSEDGRSEELVQTTAPISPGSGGGGPFRRPGAAHWHHDCNPARLSESQLRDAGGLGPGSSEDGYLFCRADAGIWADRPHYLRSPVCLIAGRRVRRGQYRLQWRAVWIDKQVQAVAVRELVRGFVGLGKADALVRQCAAWLGLARRCCPAFGGSRGRHVCPDFGRFGVIPP